MSKQKLIGDRITKLLISPVESAIDPDQYQVLCNYSKDISPDYVKEQIKYQLDLQWEDQDYANKLFQKNLDNPQIVLQFVDNIIANAKQNRHNRYEINTQKFFEYFGTGVLLMPVIAILGYFITTVWSLSNSSHDSWVEGKDENIDIDYYSGDSNKVNYIQLTPLDSKGKINKDRYKLPEEFQLVVSSDTKSQVKLELTFSNAVKKIQTNLYDLEKIQGTVGKSVTLKFGGNLESVRIIDSK